MSMYSPNNLQTKDYCSDKVSSQKSNNEKQKLTMVQKSWNR